MFSILFDFRPRTDPAWSIFRFNFFGKKWHSDYWIIQLQLLGFIIVFTNYHFHQFNIN